MRGFWIGLAVVGTAGMACAQSLNIDLDDHGSPPFAGGGAPSAAFGGAASQPGYWQSISAAGLGTNQLRGIDGQLSGAWFVGPNGGGGLAFNNPSNTGDYALLLNDGRTLGSFAEPETYRFVGLTSGTYKVFTFAVASWGEVSPMFVSVEPSSTSNPQMVTGPMPGNQFIQGITHTVHTVTVTHGELAITVVGTMGIPAYVNGFQIQLVPEPASCWYSVRPLECLLREGNEHDETRPPNPDGPLPTSTWRSA